MYQALYRSERPETFSEILGQEHIVKILRHQIATDSVSHAYLFCGTRGTGKTSTARILAKAVNCLDSQNTDKPCGKCLNCTSIKDGSFMDVIEIDAASNNGVENIRELRESVKYPPAVGRKKVYIIDEVHMLSTGAANALLKTLEEPPENVIFILATTEPHKLAATILSRCMRLDFKRVSTKVLVESMRKICEKRGVSVTEGGLKLLANAADGSVRDGMSILDQVLASGEKTLDRDMVLEYMGTVGDEFFIELTECVATKNVSEGLILLNEALADGKDVKHLMKDWLAHYRNLLIVKFLKEPEDVLNMSTENIEKIKEQSKHISLEEINEAILRLSKTISQSQWSTQPRVLLEMALVAIATDLVDESQVVKPKSLEKPFRLEREKKNEPCRSLEEKEGEKKKSEFSERVENEEASSSSKNAIIDKEQLWHDIFANWDGGVAVPNMLVRRTRLWEIKDHTFLVIASNKLTQKTLENNREKVEKAVSERLGRPVGLICKEIDGDVSNYGESSSLKDGEDGDIDGAKIAKELNIDITIK